MREWNKNMKTKKQPTYRTHNPAPRAANNTARSADDLVVRFESGIKTLGASEVDLVHRWVEGWLPRDTDAMVVMACTAPTARAARVDRLRMLRDLLARMGVAEDSVRYTGDRIEADAPGTASTEPLACTATLKVVSARHAERQVRSIRSYFVAVGGRKEAPCTSAS